MTTRKPRKVHRWRKIGGAMGGKCNCGWPSPRHKVGVIGMWLAHARAAKRRAERVEGLNEKE